MLLLVPIRVKFSSMSESIQTSQADLCDVKRCSCVVFFPKSTEKRLDKQARKSSPIPPPPPPLYLCAPEWCSKNLSRFLPCSTGCPYLVYPRERTLGLFVKSFLPAFREKQHRNIFSHHTGRLVKFGWILTNLKISVKMALTQLLPRAIQLLLLHGNN